MVLLSHQNTTLRDHLHKTLTYALLYVQKKVDPSIHKAAIIASAFHDIGKADYRFQNKSISERNTFLHAFLGLSVVDKVLELLKIKETIASLIILTIATHHSSTNPNLYMSIDNDMKFEVLPTEIDEFQNLIKSLLVRLGYHKDFVIDTSSLRLPRVVLELAKRRILMSDDGIELRKKFTYIKSAVILSNYLSRFPMNTSLLIYPNDFIKQSTNLYKKKAKKLTGNLLITYPPGFDRFETALYWAKNNITDKLFYVLPSASDISFTSNKLMRIFGDSNTGVYATHFEAFLSNLPKIKFNESEMYRDSYEFYKYLLFMSSNSLPVNVTTIDQLLLTFANYKNYALRSYGLYNSTVILDSFVPFDYTTFFFVKYLLKYLHEYGSKICIMTPSFPREFKNEFNFLKAHTLFTRTELVKKYKMKRRTRPVYHDETIFSAIDDIVKDYRSGKNVIILLSTVRNAQKIYAILKDKLHNSKAGKTNSNLILLHSRFVERDKSKKIMKITSYIPQTENQDIEIPKILVSTHRFGTSLHIDYDVMYTEATYPSLLLHLVELVNRYDKHKTPCLVHIYRPLSVFPIERHLMEYTLSLLEHLTKNFTSEYSYFALAETFYSDMWDSIKDAEEDRFEKIWKIVSYVFSTDFSVLETRDILRTQSGIIGLSVYPVKFKSRVEEINQRIFDLIDSLVSKTKANFIIRKRDLLRVMHLLNKKKNLSLNIPLSYYYTLEQNFMGDYFVNLNYSEEEGISDEKNKMM